MTVTARIIDLMQGEKALTAREIAKKLNLDVEQVRNVVKSMVRTGIANSVIRETQYKLTPKGDAKPPVVRSQQEKDRLKRRALRKKELREEREKRQLVNREMSKGFSQERAERASEKAALRAIQANINAAKTGQVANSVFNWR